LIRVWNWMIKITIVGKVIQEEELAEEITETEEGKEIDLQEIAAQTPEGQDIAVEYYTEAPQAFENEISETKKQIIVSAPSELNYTDILAYTELPAEAPENTIRLFHIINGSREETNITKYDLNGNNLTDYVEWIVPSLSNQTYELIIEISKAEHLDENRSFISDIYQDVYELDGNWSETINNNEYVRVTFEQNLTKDNDITIYARSAGNNSAEIEVYRENSDEVIVKFENIKEENWYKVYLDELGDESYEIFDLRILGRIEFDYIVDPVIAENVVPLGNLVNITAEANFTHLNISTTAPYNELIGYWNFDGDKENTLLTKHYDWSANNYDGTGVNQTYVNSTDCVYGDCAKFDDDEDFIVTSNIPTAGLIEYSYSFWIKTTDTKAIPITWASEMRFCRIGYVANKINCPADGGSVGSATSTTSINNGNWHYVVISSNATAQQLYINGLNEANATETLGTTSGVVRLGQAVAAINNLYDFNGSLDEVMIFNTSLTATEVLAIYNNQSARFLASGTQEIFNQSYMNITSGYNRVNVTTYIENNLGSSINLSVGYYDTSWSYTAPQVVSSGAVQTFTISSTSTNLTLNYTFYAGNSTAPFYSPIIKENITFEAWNEVTGDTTPPNINFTSPTPSNASTQAATAIFVNVSANDSSTGNSNISTFIDFDNSLLAWWRMDDVNGSGDVVDYLGINNGTKKGTCSQVSAGYLGKGFQFNNSGNVTTAAAVMPVGSNKISYGGWIKWYSIGNNGDGGDIPIHQSDAGWTVGHYILGSANTVVCGDSVVNTDAYSISPNVWYHIFCVHNSTNMTLYVNGIARSLIGSTTTAANIAFQIGSHYGTYQFNGSIDDVMVFNRTLSDSEIAGLYALELS